MLLVRGIKLESQSPTFVQILLRLLRGDLYTLCIAGERRFVGTNSLIAHVFSRASGPPATVEEDYPNQEC